MAILNLSTVAGDEYAQGIDGTAIKHYVHGIESGVVLDATGFVDKYIYEGHGVIQETATGEYKPLPISGQEVATLDLTGTVSTAGNLSISADGAAQSVAVALSDTAAQVGDKIRATAFPGYTLSGTGAQVLFTSDTTGNKVDVTYSVGTSAGVTGVVTTAQGTGETPSGHALIGVVRSTTRTSHPSTGVMTHGTINNNVVKYPFSAAQLVVLRDLGVYNQVD